MQFRSVTTISALALGAALFTVPVFAADGSVEGGKASINAAVDRDAPLTLPAKATAKPIPTIDPASLSRGIGGMDADAAVASMTTVTMNRDGTTAETPAPEGLRAIIAQDVKGAPPHKGPVKTDPAPPTPPTPSPPTPSPPTPPKPAPPTPPTPEVTPPSAAVQVTDTSTNPYINVGWVWAQKQDGNWWTCTGTQIGPKTVITSADCLYDHATGGWVKALIWYPGMTDGKTAPYGQFDWANMNILKGFIDNYDGSNFSSVMPWDLGEIELSEDATNLGWLGFKIDDATDFNANLIGYPDGVPVPGSQWKSTCTVPANNFGDTEFVHDCSTAPGDGGAAMFSDDGNGNFLVRGIHVADSADGKSHYGLRLTDAYFQFLQDNYR